MNSILLFLFITTLSFIPNEVHVDHAIYISVTEIELHNNEDSQVSIKIFTDDLKGAIQNYSGKLASTSDEIYFNTNKEELTAYINKYFDLNLDNYNVKLKYQSFSIEGDACFIHFTFNSSKTISSLSLKAEYLMELFPTQQNIVKINFENDNRFLKFDSATNTQTVNFD